MEELEGVLPEQEAVDWRERLPYIAKPRLQDLPELRSGEPSKSDREHADDVPAQIASRALGKPAKLVAEVVLSVTRRLAPSAASTASPPAASSCPTSRVNSGSPPVSSTTRGVSSAA